MNVALFHMFMTFTTFIGKIRFSGSRFSLVCQRAKPAKRDGPTRTPATAKAALAGDPAYRIKASEKASDFAC